MNNCVIYQRPNHRNNQIHIMKRDFMLTVGSGVGDFVGAVEVLGVTILLTTGVSKVAEASLFTSVTAASAAALTREVNWSGSFSTASAAAAAPALSTETFTTTTVSSVSSRSRRWAKPEDALREVPSTDPVATHPVPHVYPTPLQTESHTLETILVSSC